MKTKKEIEERLHLLNKEVKEISRIINDNSGFCGTFDILLEKKLDKYKKEISELKSVLN